MLPEGVDGRRAFLKTGAAAPLTNELLENSKLAVDKLWKQRGYDPKQPDMIKARLGYALDQYEVSAYLVTGAMHKPLTSHLDTGGEVYRQAHPEHHRAERHHRGASASSSRFCWAAASR